MKNLPGYGDQETWGPVRDPRDPRYEEPENAEQDIQALAEDVIGPTGDFYPFRPDNFAESLAAIAKDNDLDAAIARMAKTAEDECLVALGVELRRLVIEYWEAKALEWASEAYQWKERSDV